MKKIPVSVISPVRNCIHEMPTHAAHLRELAQIAEEVVVIDSDSSDGTLEYLKEHLLSEGVIFLNHPPGLYPSWNHAISKASAKYCTVATVGDPLPPESLQSLFDTMEASSCDVLITAPTLLNADGSPASNKWPIHQLIEECKLTRPTAIRQSTWMVLALGFFQKSPLSSSSGNLYRTEFMQAHPFPVHCGHRGDVLWGIEVSRKARWMIDPTVRSFFKFHPPSNHKELPNCATVRTLTDAAKAFQAANVDFLKQEGVGESMMASLSEMIETSCAALMTTAEYQYTRRTSPLPWFFNPLAIRLRKQRKILKGRKIDRKALLGGFLLQAESH